MRRPLAWLAILSTVVTTLGALSTIAACADSDSQDPDLGAPVASDDGGTTILDDAQSQSRPVDATDEGFGRRQTCSSAGWCDTELPADTLIFHDLWPVGDRAFGLAESQPLGYKFLEWDAVEGWKFIDRKLQFNQVSTPTSVWAPDENEVFYAVWNLSGLLGGTFGAIILHGKRPTPPETSWDWTRSQIDCNGFQFDQSKPVLSGTNPDNVYVALCGNVYRLKRGVASGDAGADGGDGGADGGTAIVTDGWELDYALPGTGFAQWRDATQADGDVWFSGVRGNYYGPASGMCAVLVRKAADGSTSVVLDGDATSGTCVANAGTAMRAGQLSYIHAMSKDQLVATAKADVDNDLVLVSLTGGEVAITTVSPAATMDVTLTSPWGTSLDDLWMLASLHDHGMILHAASVWDGGSFDISTLAINGAPNKDSLVRLRGTSNQNLWAVGELHAFHKTFTGVPTSP